MEAERRKTYVFEFEAPCPKSPYKSLVFPGSSSKFTNFPGGSELWVWSSVVGDTHLINNPC